MGNTLGAASRAMAEPHGGVCESFELGCSSYLGYKPGYTGTNPGYHRYTTMVIFTVVGMIFFFGCLVLFIVKDISKREQPKT